MEDRGKRKLLATASCQGQAVRAVTEGLIDRLSNLPDHVAHHILSFLAIEDLTRFGCVSKGYGELYLSAPSYLFHRGVNRIARFHFHWNLDIHQPKIFREDERFRLDKWIYNAIRCNVEVLDINIENSCLEAPPLPFCIFLCGSLKSLVVEMYCKISKAPSLASLSNLECLKLQDVIILDEGFFKWISCSCKCIKELSLIHVHGNGGMHFTIESSSLESLCIKWVYGMFHLNISGQKLRKIIINWIFAYRTDSPHTDICLRNQLNLGRLESLEEAEICLLNHDDFVIVSEVLCCLCSAKVLILNKEITMILVPAMTSLLGGMSKLSTLIIKSNPFFRGPKADVSKSRLSPISSSSSLFFLNRSKLITLTITLRSYYGKLFWKFSIDLPVELLPSQCCGFNIGYWKLQNAAFIYQLKEVTIELSHGSNGIEFARYILEHAQNLIKMTIVHSPRQSNAMRKLNTSKMTSNITLDFQEDQRRGPQKQRGRRVV
ncbi:putative F-box domain, FBD domain, leucine-rich repeat domain, L domain-containing protein [Rosa chinensis]|uniref:Putative F-box domain, FBD domain, leucine-rich repeat domain, L domain-containing protein n=1 Tax=Rosa chinensis TaxID=74649 RepID=A0A2P6RC23_ROSCH|nr:putative F-box domain, FBD domain, leucine-rich repeat domain, L domain-containing protein [Rosa chinensis]